MRKRDFPWLVSPEFPFWDAGHPRPSSIPSLELSLTPSYPSATSNCFILSKSHILFPPLLCCEMHHSSPCPLVLLTLKNSLFDNSQPRIRHCQCLTAFWVCCIVKESMPRCGGLFLCLAPPLALMALGPRLSTLFGTRPYSVNVG